MVAVNFRQMTNTNQVVVYFFENFITFAIVRKKIEFDQKPESPCNYAISLFVCSDFNLIAIWQFFVTKLFQNVLRFNQMSFFHVNAGFQWIIASIWDVDSHMTYIGNSIMLFTLSIDLINNNKSLIELKIYLALR